MVHLLRLCLGASLSLILVLAPAQAQSPAPDEPMQRAIGLFETGQLDAAVRALEAILREHPEQRLALRYLGLAYLRLDRPAEAESVLARAGADPPVLYALGVAEARLGKLEDARRAFRRTIDAAPESSEAERARAYIDSLAGPEEKPAAAEAATLASPRGEALILRAGLQYDDNVPPRAPGDPGKRASPRAIVSGEAYRDLYETGGWRLRAEGQATAARSFESELRRFDIVDLEAGLDLGYSAAISGVGIRPGLSYALEPTLEGGRLANVGHLLTTSVAVSPADAWVTSLAHLVRFSPFVDQSVEVGGRETGGTLQTVRLLQYYLPPSGAVQLYGGYSYEWSDLPDPNASYRGSRLTLGASLGLSAGLRLDARAETYFHDYPRFTQSPRRSSQGSVLEAFLSYELGQAFTLSAGYQRSGEDSNIPAARYSRNLFTVLVSRTF